MSQIKKIAPIVFMVCRARQLYLTWVLKVGIVRWMFKAVVCVCVCVCVNGKQMALYIVPLFLRRQRNV